MAKGHKATDTDPGGTPVIVLAVLGGDIEVIDFLLLKGATRTRGAVTVEPH